MEQAILMRMPGETRLLFGVTLDVYEFCPDLGISNLCKLIYITGIKLPVHVVTGESHEQVK